MSGVRAVTPSASKVAQGSGARVLAENVRKSFGDVQALEDVTLQIESGEFLALLGPSGSGKTTLLMTMAGFESPDSGRITFNDVDITAVPAHKRQLGMMFQRYALFPHLNVLKNVEYPLRARGMARRDRRPLVEEALRLVSLVGFEHRRIDQLSGGQQQRVALARAIVFSPSLLLMDEPLGALDRKLRQEVQLELRQLHRRINSTVVFVTHDQEEAMTMADRVAVMDNARIVQVGTPSELFERPSTKFVAGFLGSMNFLDVRPLGVTDDGLHIKVDDLIMTIANNRFFGHVSSNGLPSKATLAIRPHELRIQPAVSEGLAATVEEVIYAGARSTVVLDASKRRLMADVPSQQATQLSIADRVSVTWDPNNALLYFE